MRDVRLRSSVAYLHLPQHILMDHKLDIRSRNRTIGASLTPLPITSRRRLLISTLSQNPINILNSTMEIQTFPHFSIRAQYSKAKALLPARPGLNQSTTIPTWYILPSTQISRSSTHLACPTKRRYLNTLILRPTSLRRLHITTARQTLPYPSTNPFR